MNISDKDYLRRMLKSLELELNEVQIQHRIAIAEFNIKRDILNRQIDSIELQLKENTK